MIRTPPAPPPAGARRHTRRRVVAVTILPAFLVSGCVTFVPEEPGALSPDTEVRVTLLPAGARRAAATWGWSQEVVEGRLEDVTDDSVSVSVRVAPGLQGTDFAQARQVFTLGRDELVEVERREIARGRTALLVAGGVAVLGIVVAALLEVAAGTGDDGPGPGPDPTPAVIPVPGTH